MWSVTYHLKCVCVYVLNVMSVSLHFPLHLLCPFHVLGPSYAVLVPVVLFFLLMLIIPSYLHYQTLASVLLLKVTNMSRRNAAEESGSTALINFNVNEYFIADKPDEVVHFLSLQIF